MVHGYLQSGKAFWFKCQCAIAFNENVIVTRRPSVSFNSYKRLRKWKSD